MKSGGNGRQAQEEASFRKATADTQFFWNQVTRNNGTVRKLQRVLNPQLRAREESQLFGNHTDVLQGVIQDSTPVERSGPGADTFPVLEKFSDLNNLPSFIARNIRLMRYESPSPIQKHSVPLGLAGLDLMCCAQTVREEKRLEKLCTLLFKSNSYLSHDTFLLNYSVLGVRQNICIPSTCDHFNLHLRGTCWSRALPTAHTWAGCRERWWNPLSIATARTNR